MRTPDEIKKGLECCYTPVEPAFRCEECPYHGSIVCKMRLHTDALPYIQQLETKCHQLESTISQVSKALCSKENATAEEIIAAFS